jgi:hypothetical protein
MATSFISKGGDHGFWVRDSLLQIVCWGFYNVLDNSAILLPDWMKGEYREYVYHCSQGLFIGFTTLRLEEYLVNPERIHQYNELIQYARDFFLNKGEYISEGEVNGFQMVADTRSNWTKPFETKRAMKILDYIEDVINDRISIKVSDKIDYDF